MRSVSFHPDPRAARAAGFTLIELMIVVVVIGILAAIAIPNFVSLQRRAQEGSVKSNMHTVQVTLEDFALQNDFTYPVNGSTQLSDGRTLGDICPTGSFPVNPFTHLPTTVVWNANPTTGNKGELAINPALTNSYKVKGNGPLGDTLNLVLTSGQ